MGYAVVIYLMEVCHLFLDVYECMYLICNLLYRLINKTNDENKTAEMCFFFVFLELLCNLLDKTVSRKM